MKKLQTSQARATVGGATSWARKLGGTVSNMPTPAPTPLLPRPGTVSNMPTPLVLG